MQAFLKLIEAIESSMAGATPPFNSGDEARAAELTTWMISHCCPLLGSCWGAGLGAGIGNPAKHHCSVDPPKTCHQGGHSMQAD
eukprot:1147083-Pelagomonas_calceolata.AAC.2